MKQRRSIFLLVLGAAAVIALVVRHWVIDQQEPVSVNVAAPQTPPARVPTNPVSTDHASEIQATVRRAAESTVSSPVATAEPLGYDATTAVAYLDGQAQQNGWEKEYRGMAKKDLLAVRSELEAAIYDETKEELERRFSAGQYETYCQGTTYDAHDFDPTSIYWIRVPPGGPVLKCTLPRANFPDVYKQKALSAWLDLKSRTAPE